MLIASKLFKQPTPVELPLPNGGFRTYTFAPLVPGGACVAEIEDEAHIDRLLGISEGFKLVMPAAAPAMTLDKTETSPAPSEAAAVEEGDGGAPVAASPAVHPPFEDMTDDELRAAFEARYGRKAHPAARREKIIARLTEPEGDDSASDQED